MTTLVELNGCPEGRFVDLVGGVFEHSPWIARQAFLRRPFGNVAAIHEAMCAVVNAAPEERQLDLIRAHPDLVGRLAREGRLTHESTIEQASAGLDRLAPHEIELFERYNAAYRERFGFPFVICVREHRKQAILDAFPPRLENPREVEIKTALNEIFKIAWLRLKDRVREG